MLKNPSDVALGVATGLAIGLVAAHCVPCMFKKQPNKAKGKMTLSYFGIPALGEPCRLLLELGDFDWEDKRISFSEWGDIKPTTKWGQVPLLEVGGEQISQTKVLVPSASDAVIHHTRCVIP